MSENERTAAGPSSLTHEARESVNSVHTREDRSFLAGLEEGRQEGLDALEALADALGTNLDSLPRGGAVDAKRLDVLLCMAIEAMRHRQAETRGELRIPQTE